MKITVTTKSGNEITGEFDGLDLNRDVSNEGVWLFLKNCSDGFKSQGFALCNMQKVKTEKQHDEMLAKQESKAVKDLEQQLAAANARIAELEQQQFAGQTWVTFDEHMKALKKIKQMEDAIKFDFERFMEFQQRAEQAEAQCKRIREALEEIASFDGWKSDIAKAALEEKP